MIYIGSGCIGEKLANSHLSQDSNYDFLWGRRIRRIKLSNLKTVFRKRVIYLDTVDAWSNKASGIVWLWWVVWPYRIEKMLMYVILLVLCKRVARLHVPSIADSDGWKKRAVDETEHPMPVPAFTYASLLEFVAYVDSQENGPRSYTSVKMFEIAQSNGMTIEIVQADPSINASKLVGRML